MPGSENSIRYAAYNPTIEFLLPGMPNPTAKGLMSAPVSVKQELSVYDAHALMASKSFHAVPVVDDAKKVVGILTEYDLLVNGLSLYLPTFEKMMVELSVDVDEQLAFKNVTEGLKKMKVGDIMNREPIVFLEDTSFQEMVRVLCDHHRVVLVPVVDKEGVLHGVISKFDILKIFSQHFETSAGKH